MAKTKTVKGPGGKEVKYRWAKKRGKYQWVRDHGGFGTLGKITRKLLGIRDPDKKKKNEKVFVPESARKGVTLDKKFTGGKDSKSTSKTNKKKPNVKSVGTVDFNVNTPGGLASYNKALKASKNKKTDKEKDAATTEVLHGKRNREKAKGSNVFTKHYKTGKALGVMTRSQRRKYDAEAKGRTFEKQVAKHEKESGHGKSHKRETLYKASLRKKRNKLKV
jgi:hypothetical protein